MKKKFYELCESVEIDGKEYAINTDFKVWIEIEHIILQKGTDSPIALAEILCLAYPKLPPDPGAAVRGLLWFYSAGEEQQRGCEQKKPVYDLALDFNYVWGAFLAEFGIDIAAQNMHWWKFRALLSCLGDTNKFSQIVGYRSADLAKVKDKEKRMYLAKMKKRFRLASSLTEDEVEWELAQQLESVF